MMTVGAQRAVTGADGWADVDDVPVGAYDVRVTHDGHTAVGKARQVVVERQTTDCGRVELQRAGRLRGKVLSADGRPVDYALVESRPVDALQWSEPQVVMEGSFRMDALAPGRHLVRARPMSQHPGEGELFGPEVEVVIAGGKTVTTEVRLPAK